MCTCVSNTITHTHTHTHTHTREKKKRLSSVCSCIQLTRLCAPTAYDSIPLKMAPTMVVRASDLWHEDGPHQFEHSPFRLQQAQFLSHLCWHGDGVWVSEFSYERMSWARGIATTKQILLHAQKMIKHSMISSLASPIIV